MAGEETVGFMRSFAGRIEQAQSKRLNLKHHKAPRKATTFRGALWCYEKGGRHAHPPIGLLVLVRSRCGRQLFELDKLAGLGIDHDAEVQVLVAGGDDALVQ